MKLLSKFDSNGFFIEYVTIGDFSVIPNDCTSIPFPEGLYKPQFVNGSWIEGETSANLLQRAKDAKKVELDLKCDLTIMGGFTSSALGSAHTYQSLLVDEVWLNATINRFAIDPNFTTVQYKTVDAGYLAHSKTQFNQVFIDGHSFGDSQITKLNNLKSQVDAATTITGVDAITW